jgi:hypothetical protein
VDDPTQELLLRLELVAGLRARLTPGDLARRAQHVKDSLDPLHCPGVIALLHRRHGLPIEFQEVLSATWEMVETRPRAVTTHWSYRMFNLAFPELAQEMHERAKPMMDKVYAASREAMERHMCKPSIEAARAAAKASRKQALPTEDPTAQTEQLRTSAPAKRARPQSPLKPPSGGSAGSSAAGSAPSAAAAAAASSSLAEPLASVDGQTTVQVAVPPIGSPAYSSVSSDSESDAEQEPGFDKSLGW